ncbi:MAG: flagellar hook-basal body complex protein FliE [Thermoleophilaceae bacterium]
MPLPIDPSFAVAGPEWSIAPAGASAPAPASGGSGEGDFGGMLAQQISHLEQLQTDASQASRELATGTATDLPSVVNAVERAKLSMEVASTIRTKSVEAFQEIFRTHI